MSAHRRQIGILLRNALRMDFRGRGAGRERWTRNVQPFTINLFFYLVIGAMLGSALPRAGIALHAQATLAYTLAGVLLLINLLVEYQEILLAPTDAEVLGWRPILSRTLYMARVLHVFFYVGLLTAILLAVPAVTTGLLGSAGSPAVCAAFWVGGMLNALLVTAGVLLVQGALLNRLSPDRFQDVLGNVQLVFMVAIVLGYQLLTPELLGRAFGPRSSLGPWLVLFPPAWFAALPALVASPPTARLLGSVALGLFVCAAAWAFAIGRLAPGYQVEVESVRLAAGNAPGRPARASALQVLLGRWLGRRPLRRTGFEFLLAQMRGDRRIRVGMMPLVALPVGILLAALAMGGRFDPYAHAPDSALGSLWAHAPGAGARGDDAPSRAYWLLFYAVYMLSTLAISIGRNLSRCNDWRAAWVFHAAPVGRYDEFFAGVLWGVVYAVLAPAVFLVGLILLWAWRNPLHVAAHLAMPAGLALVALTIAQAIDFAPPFSREPLRHARGRETAVALVVVGPLLALAWLQHLLRYRPALLVLAGVALALLAKLLWWPVARRVRNVFLQSSFDA